MRGGPPFFQHELVRCFRLASARENAERSKRRGIYDILDLSMPAAVDLHKHTLNDKLRDVGTAVDAQQSTVEDTDVSIQRHI